MRDGNRSLPKALGLKQFMKLFFADAFAEKALSGNPAPVVCDADHLSDADKQRLAKELNASETVFVSRSEVADFKLRFFTPKHEIDLCGHGTVGAFWVLASTGRIASATSTVQVRQETRAGVLPVDVHFSPNGRVQKIMMHQKPPTFQEHRLDRALVAEVLRIRTDDIWDELPIQSVSTGRMKLMVPVLSQRALYAIDPDYDRMARLCEEVGTNGFHVFTFETHDPKSITVARHFAPTAGVNEDVVTGNAAGALGCYLVTHGGKRVPQSDKHSFVMEQGHNLDRAGKVYVDIEQAGEEITRVRVGGTAVILFETDLALENEPSV
jgi:trans-2,3-dihydro-3-hydroxyanthranilate isomerase